MTVTNRIHGLDALRAIAMLLGIFLHASIFHLSRPLKGWPADDSYHSLAFDYLYHWIHSFRMPLFFLIAGFFARFLYYKIGETAFIRRRFKRIVIPFAISLAVILPPSSFPFLYNALLKRGNAPDDAIWAAIPEMFSWNGLYHLWFLYYLIVFYMVMVAVFKAARRFNWRVSGGAFKVLGAGSILTIGFLTLVLFVFFDAYVEPWTGMIIPPGQALYYGSFFLIGVLINRRFTDFKISRRTSWAFFVIGSALTPLIAGMLSSSAGKLTLNFMVVVQTYLLTMGSLGLFLNYFKTEDPVLRYISDSAYWLYLIHFPLLATIQTFMVGSVIPGFLRFWIALALTIFLCLWSYQKWVRYSVVGEYLHGKRTKKQVASTLAAK